MANLTHEDYTIGWICALDLELAASMAVIDEENPSLPQHTADSNSYTLCRICKHNVVMATLPSGQMGNNSAASVVSRMTLTFPAIRFGIMVGVGGGVPSVDENGKVLVDIRLGDIVVSNPGTAGGGVVQYDFGKTAAKAKFIQTGSLNHPPKIVLTALQTIKARHRFRRLGFLEHLAQIPEKLGSKYSYVGVEHDKLFGAEYDHPGDSDNCDQCEGSYLVSREPRENLNPVIHYGVIASGNRVMCHGGTRERLRRENPKIRCFEMEAAGLMNEFPCVVIRGIADYSDSHKHKDWQPYAAAAAAAYAKELLSVVPVGHAFSVVPAPIVPGHSQSALAYGSQTSPTASPTSPINNPGPSWSSSPIDLMQTDSSDLLRTTTPLRASTVGKSLVQSLTSAFTVVTNSFLPWNRAALGRLVLNIDDPGQDYCPHMPFGIRPSEISVVRFQGISEAFDIGGDSRLVQRFKALLARILGNKQEERSVYNSMAHDAITYQLLNSGDFFERLLQDESTRRWIEKHKDERARDVYLIVGIHALLNFEINIRAGSEQSTQSVDSTSSADSNRSSDKTLKVGDRIIGVQYRRVRVQGWSSKDMPAVVVDKKSWWKKYYRLDQIRAAENLEVDVLTAELDETPTASDIREEMPSNWRIDVCRSEISGEDFVFLVDLSNRAKSSP